MTAKRSPERPLIHFKWSRCEDGYRLVEDNKIIIAAGITWEEAPPVPADLYAKFASKGSTAGAMLAFCNKYGLLRGVGSNAVPTGYNMASYARVEDLLRDHKLLRSALLKYEEGDVGPVVHHLNISSGMVAHPLLLRGKDRVDFVISPPDLITGMWLQFGLHAAALTTIIRCRYCSGFIPIGRGTKSRSTREFCDNNGRCRQAFFREKPDAAAVTL
jgi:hypothetical protein